MRIRVNLLAYIFGYIKLFVDDGSAEALAKRARLLRNDYGDLLCSILFCR